MRTNKFFVSAALIVLGLASCSKEETMPAERQITLVANIEGCVDTKTSLSGDDATGYQVLWSEGDQITLVNGFLSFVFTLSQGAESTRGTFVGTCPDGEYQVFYGIDVLQSGRFDCNGSNLTCPAPMMANITVSDGVASMASFRNLCGLLRLTLKGSGIVKDIKVHADLPLNGPFSIDEKKGYAVIERTYGPENYENILDCGDGVELTETGKEFFIPMPQNEYDNVRIVIADFAGNTCTKTLQVGKTLNITRAMITPVSLRATNITSLPEGALPGAFTVNNNGKKVYFSRGNLYWDGDSFEFEENQDAHLTSRDENHVDHFYWAKEASAARSKTPISQDFTSSDVLFTNATSESPNPDFTVNGVTGRYRTLSSAEWLYLFEKHPHKWVTVNYNVGMENVCFAGMVIAPDGVGFDYSKNSYSRDELASGGLVFLPAAGNTLNNGNYQSVADMGEYWSSTATATADTDRKAYNIRFRYDGYEFFENYSFYSHCTTGMSIRLVTE